MNIYSDYNRPSRKGITFTEPTLTQQHFANEVNINAIMDRYQKTGIMVDPTKQGNHQPQFGNYTGVDFQNYQNIMAETMQNFAVLPAKIRARFHNDAGELLSFLADEQNKDEAIGLGLINKPPTKEPENVVKTPLPASDASGKTA